MLVIEVIVYLTIDQIVDFIEFFRIIVFYTVLFNVHGKK